MILSDGKNNFKENTFSFWEWSAPILQKPEEVIDKIHEFKLIGRTVKDIVSVGLAYNLDDALFDFEPETDEEDCCVYIRKSERDPEVTDLDCFVEIDEPMIIEFEDGDILAIDFSEGSCVRMDLNTLPKNILAGINPLNFHANILFKNIIGKKLFDIKVTQTISEPDFTGSCGLELEEQSSYIEKIIFEFRENNSISSKVSLGFEACFDYGIVTMTDMNDKIMQIHNGEIDALINGFDYYSR